MKSSHEDIILLENYLNNILSAEEKQNLELRLKHEEDLAADLLTLKHIVAATRVKTLEEKHEFLQSLESENQKTSKGFGWQLWLIIIFFGIVAGYLLYNWSFKSAPQPEEKYKGIYASVFDEQLILHTTMRSAVQTNSLSPEQKRAYDLYSLQLFDEAAPLLTTLWQEKKDTLALFYLGVSRVGKGETEEGLKILRRDELAKYRDQTNLFFNQ